MRSSRIGGIIRAEVCVIKQMQTEALMILHILREPTDLWRQPNSIIVLLFIGNISHAD